MTLKKILLFPALGILVAATLLCAGCSTPKNARNSAELLAAYTTKVKQDAELFAKSRENLAKARQDTANRLEQATLWLENDARRSQDRWKIAGDKARLDLFSSLMTAADEFAERSAQAAELQARRAQELTQIQSGVSVRSKKLAETAKALGELSKKRRPKEQLGFLIDFASEVRKSIKEAEEAGKQAADDGTAAAKNAETTDAAADTGANSITDEGSQP